MFPVLDIDPEILMDLPTQQKYKNKKTKGLQPVITSNIGFQATAVSQSSPVKLQRQTCLALEAELPVWTLRLKSMKRAEKTKPICAVKSDPTHLDSPTM